MTDLESTSESEPGQPVITIKRGRALPFFQRHPWVFTGAIQQTPASLTAGQGVQLRDHKGKFIAYGLYNEASNIKVRLYSWDEQTPLLESFWLSRLQRAVRHRQLLFPNANSQAAFRVINSEADGLSGLTVDRYGDWLLVQLTSKALAEHRDLLFRLLEQELKPRGIWLRTEKGIRTLEGLEIEDGLIAGEEPPRPLFIEEHGTTFGIDAATGQKTGFYLDQRDNRAAVARYVKGHRLLDLFCYSGAFGITAIKQGGAESVIAVDSSSAALALAGENSKLNEIGDRITFIQGKVFDQLEQLRAAGEKFDSVILDPPKMTRNRKGLSQAMRGYHSLNEMAVSLLNPGGILVTCSCSGLVSRELFDEMLAKVATRSDRSIQILESRGAAADHPISVHCSENNYLKCYICRVG